MIDTLNGLTAFLKNFHRHWLADPRLDAALIPHDLPAPLQLLYREVGALIEIKEGPSNNYRAPFSAQDILLPLSRLRRVEGMVEFAAENQDDWQARCPLNALDPPVFSNASDLFDARQQGFIEVCGSLSHFLITLALQEAVMSCRNLTSFNSARPPGDWLTIPLRPLWLGGRTVFGEPDHNFYVSAEVDVLVMDWSGQWIGSPTRDVVGLLKG